MSKGLSHDSSNPTRTPPLRPLEPIPQSLQLLDPPRHALLLTIHEDPHARDQQRRDAAQRARSVPRLIRPPAAEERKARRQAEAGHASERDVADERKARMGPKGIQRGCAEWVPYIRGEKG